MSQFQNYRYAIADTEIQEGQGVSGTQTWMDVITGAPQENFRTIAQSLVKFDLGFMFAYARPVTILYATLSFKYIFDQFGLPTQIHACACPGSWDEFTATWTNMNGPLIPSGPASVGEKIAMGQPGHGVLTFSGDELNAILQAWANGAPNNGFVISPNLPAGQNTPEFMRLTTREGDPQPTLFTVYSVGQPDNPEA